MSINKNGTTNFTDVYYNSRPIYQVVHNDKSYWCKLFNLTVNSSGCSGVAVTRTGTQNPDASTGTPEYYYGIYRVYYGDTIRLYATPFSGYEVDGDNPRTIIITGDTTAEMKAYPVDVLISPELFGAWEKGEVQIGIHNLNDLRVTFSGSVYGTTTSGKQETTQNINMQLSSYNTSFFKYTGWSVPAAQRQSVRVTGHFTEVSGSRVSKDATDVSPNPDIETTTTTTTTTTLARSISLTDKQGDWALYTPEEEKKETES